MAEPDPAIRRFWILQLARFGAVLMVFAGALVIGRIVELPEFIGYLLLLMGAAEFFIVPKLLSKSWKSDDR